MSRGAEHEKAFSRLNRWISNSPAAEQDSLHWLEAQMMRQRETLPAIQRQLVSPEDATWLDFFWKSGKSAETEWVCRDFPDVVEARERMELNEFIGWFTRWLANYRSTPPDAESEG